MQYYCSITVFITSEYRYHNLFSDVTIPSLKWFVDKMKMHIFFFASCVSTNVLYYKATFFIVKNMCFLIIDKQMYLYKNVWVIVV